VFGVGFLGGLIGDLVVIFGSRQYQPPGYLKSRFYRVCVISMAAAGGLLTSLYGIHQVQALLALNIGASAPLILKALAAGSPKTPRVD
jgi:hypothetical protein